jgi:hypothetical protein
MAVIEAAKSIDLKRSVLSPFTRLSGRESKRR